MNRPERYNAFDQVMCDELQALWLRLRTDDDVRCIVLGAEGGKAFCTGIDRDFVPSEGGASYDFSPYTYDDPGRQLGPKSNELWKPVIAAVDGIACGGAFYLLGESEFVVADEEASFFDPHTTYGMVSAYESVYLAQRMPFGEVARMALMGTAERVSARRAHEVGLVSELAPPGEALTAALACARVIASYPPEGVQGTVRALWQAQEATRAAALAHAPQLVSLGNLPGQRQAELFAARRPGFRLR